MTNEDFIKNNLTERDIAALLMSGRHPESKIIKDARKVFSYWSSFDFTKNSNCGEKKTFSIWAYSFWSNPKTHIPERIGREILLSRQVWLSMPYNKEYWNEAVKKYNERWEINE